MADNSLQILIDVRAKLDELTKSQNAIRDLGREATGTGQALKTGLGFDIARRGLDLLTNSLRASVLESFRMADAIKDGARNLGLSNEAYQVLGNTIHDAGGDAGLLNMMVSQATRSLAEARNPASEAAGAYRSLGLNIAELEALPIEQRLQQIGQAVSTNTDRTKAFSAASQILGSRSLPTVLGALRDLAENGYDKLTEAQTRNGRVMTNDTITRLEAAKKQIEKVQQAMTIATGEAIGTSGALLNSLKKDFFGTLGDIIKAGPQGLNSGALMTRLARDNPSEPETGSNNDGNVAREIALRKALASAEFNLAAAILHRQTVENDPTRSEGEKRAQMLLIMEQELALRRELIAAQKEAPTDNEPQEARDLRVRKLEQQNIQLGNELVSLKQSGRVESALNEFFSPLDRETKAKDSELAFRTFNDPRSNPDFLTAGQGVITGAMDWVTGLGSAGQQVSGVIETSLGATVSGISDGIYGWVTGTKSFGEAMAGLGATVFKAIIDTIVQMGVQWVLTHTIMRGAMMTTNALDQGLRVQRIAGATAEGSATTAAMAPAAATASISSFGLAAVIGIAALVAAMAAFGGFSRGGYTGDMATNQVAGVVHGKEYVLNAAATSRLGRGFLDAANAGRPVSLGAPAAAFAGTGGTLAAAGGRESGRNIHVYLDRSAWLDAVQNDLSGIAHEVYDKRART